MRLKHVGLAWAVLTFFAMILPIPVFAEDADWSEILNPDGTIAFENLTYLDTVTIEDADWMTLDILGFEVPMGDATFVRYVTPSGQIVVIPDALTLVMAAANPEASGMVGAEVLENGLAMALQTLFTDCDCLQIPGDRYRSPAEFFQAVINGEENLWTVLDVTAFLNFWVNGVWQLDMDVLALGLWLYPPGVDCNAIPGGCPDLASITGGSGGGSGGFGGGECPAAYTTTGPIQILPQGQGGKIAPPYPLVVGQDPQKRGVDVGALIRIPPVVFVWYEEVWHEEEYCDLEGYTLEDCPPDHIKVEVWLECIEHRKVYPDYVASVNFSLSLDPASQAWIATELAKAYPGAQVKRPHFAFTLPGPGTLGEDDFVTLKAVQYRIPIADPGTWNVTVTVMTTGTPVSAPRMLSQSLGSFEVYLFRQTLVDEP